MRSTEIETKPIVQMNITCLWIPRLYMETNMTRHDMDVTTEMYDTEFGCSNVFFGVFVSYLIHA